MKTKGKNRQPKLGAQPNSKKIPRAGEIPNDTLRPEFKTEKMDMQGKWGWSKFAIDNIKEFLGKLFESQKLSWQELRQNGSHLISVNQIVSEASKRLQVLELDDWEELYSIRLNGKSRLWGLKESNIFWILWWDPNHEICPSYKKNT